MPKPINHQKIKRILFVRTDRMGDVVLTTPIFSAVKRARPDAYLAVMVSKENRDLVEGNPFLNQVIVYDKAGSEKSLFGAYQFIRRLRAQKFDAAILFHPRARNYWSVFLAGIPIRIGYQEKNYHLLTHSFFYNKPEGKKHEAEYNFDLLKPIGIQRPSLELYIPLQSAYKRQLEESGLQEPYVVFNASASTPSKIWPSEYFADTADQLIQKYGIQAVLIGGKEDVKFSNAMKTAMKHPVLDLTGKLEVGALAWLFKNAKLFISNDTGPVHVAAAMKIPVISIFTRSLAGLGPDRWRPLGNRSVYLLERIVTTAEFANSGVITKELIRTLTPELVVKTVDEKGWLEPNVLKHSSN